MLTLPLLIKSGVSDQYFCCIVIRDLVALSPLSPIQILSILLILHHSCLVHWNHSSLTTIFANFYSNSSSGSSQHYLQKLVGQLVRKPISSFSIHESHIYDFVSCPFHQISPGTPRKNWESNQKSTSKVNKTSAQHSWINQRNLSHLFTVQLGSRGLGWSALSYSY